MARSAGDERERVRHVPRAHACWVTQEKKTLAASEQDPDARAAWWKAVTLLNPQKLVFVDEAGTTPR